MVIFYFIIFFFPPREIGNFAIWCKKGPVLKSKVQPISEGLKQLSLQPPDSDHKYVRTHLFPPVTPSLT